MNVILNPDLEARIHRKLQNGEFESADALIEQAVDFFLGYEEEEMSGQEFRETRVAIDEALTQAERGEGISLREFDRKMRSKYDISR